MVQEQCSDARVDWLQMVVVEVDMGASLAQFQEAIRQRLGILHEQQRIIVVGEPLGPARRRSVRTE